MNITTITTMNITMIRILQSQTSNNNNNNTCLVISLLLLSLLSLLLLSSSRNRSPPPCLGFAKHHSVTQNLSYINCIGARLYFPQTFKSPMFVLPVRPPPLYPRQKLLHICVYKHIYIYIYMYIHTCTYIYICLYAYTCMRVYTYIYIYITAAYNLAPCIPNRKTKGRCPPLIYTI